jgi:hypothetical protein
VIALIRRILAALDAWTLRRIDRMVDDWEREGRP